MEQAAVSLLRLRHIRQEDIMNKIAIAFAVGTIALFATAATAAPLGANPSVAPDSNIQNVRMVCNEDGRCWRERRDRRVIVRDSYGYDAPRERYIERRGYEERHRLPRSRRQRRYWHRPLLRKQPTCRRPRRNPRLFCVCARRGSFERGMQHSSYRLRNQRLASISMDSLRNRALFFELYRANRDHIGYEMLVSLFADIPSQPFGPTNLG
jgi:hypothetical protein